MTKTLAFYKEIHDSDMMMDIEKLEALWIFYIDIPMPIYVFHHSLLKIYVTEE